MSGVERTDEGRDNDGREKGAYGITKKMVNSGDISAEKAAQYAGMTLEQFLAKANP